MTYEDLQFLDDVAKYAMQGILSAGGIRGHIDGSTDAKDHAIWAYEYATEMLKQHSDREKEINIGSQGRRVITKLTPTAIKELL